MPKWTGPTQRSISRRSGSPWRGGSRIHGASAINTMEKRIATVINGGNEMSAIFAATLFTPQIVATATICRRSSGANARDGIVTARS